MLRSSYPVALVLAVLASTSHAAQIECTEDGGQLVRTSAPIVWVSTDEGVFAVTEDPGNVPAETLAEADAVLTPDDFCAQGWILPAPHPGDPMPGPAPDVAPPKPLGNRIGRVNLRPVADRFEIEFEPGGDEQNETEEESIETEGEEAAPPADAPVVVVEAADEPTPTPATPAPEGVGRHTTARGCSAVQPSGGGSGAWFGFLISLVPLLRRRRGGR